MHPDAVPQPFFDFRPIGAVELEAVQLTGQRVFLVAGADVHAGEILRALGRLELGEMDDVHGAFISSDQGFQRPGQRRFAIRIIERHRAVVRLDGDGLASGQPRQFLLEERGIAQSGRHEQEPGLGQGQQRSLPGHAPFTVGVVMELVHDHVVHRGVRALAQGDVGQDLRGATQNGRVAIDGGVAGAQADVLGAELAAQRQPFLVDQRLDRAGIDRAFALDQALEMERRRHQRLARAGGGVEDDVLFLVQLENRRFLGRIEPELSSLGVIEETSQQHLVAEVFAARDHVIERHMHGDPILGEELDRAKANSAAATARRAPPRG